MTIEILVPDLPESVADATVATWHKKVGDTVKRDEVLVEIETDKVVLEVPALSDGVVVEILQEEGATVVSKQLLGKLSTQQAGDISTETVKDNEPTPADRQRAAIENSHNNSADQGPAIRRLLAEHDLDAEKIQGSGVGGVLPVRILRVKWQNVMHKKRNKMWRQSRIPLALWHTARVQKNVYR